MFALLGAAIGVIVGRYLGGYMAHDLHQGVSHPESGVRCAAPCLRVGRRRFTVRGAARRRAGGAAGGALAAGRSAGSSAPVSFGRLGQGIENAARNLDGKTRMVARRIARFPRRSATTVVGIMLALALLITSQHFPISMNHIVDVTFGVAQRMDATLTFAETADDRILAEVGRLPGVYSVEPLRATEVIFTAGSRKRRDTSDGPERRRLPVSPARSEHGRGGRARPDGITLSQNLANKLGVKVGDTVNVQATDGHRAQRGSHGRRSREALSGRRRVHGAGRSESCAARAGPGQRGVRADGSPRARLR